MSTALAMTNTSSSDTEFFTRHVADSDPELFAAMSEELERQKYQIELIASENIASNAVLEVQGSVLTNKYAEGYPGKRYYGGCEFVDKAETLAIERAKELYNCSYANVQPNSGSQANQGVFTALIKPGATILGQSLAAGGHLTHGAAPNQSGKWFNAIQYGVREDNHLIDYDQVAEMAREHKPDLLIAGFSAYPRVIDWQKFRDIADEVGCWFMVDMAHISGLVAGGSYPSPLPFADVVTTTTHKTLRGPRGGMILSSFPDKVVRTTKSGKDITLGQALNSAIFPGIQGGPLMHVIAAKATAYKEALTPEYKAYAHEIVDNARVLADTIKGRGYDIVSGGTDNHIVLVDLRPKGVKGNAAEDSLERAGLTCNKNNIPFDPEPPMVTSGIRLGTPAGTTRGFGKEEFAQVGNLISDVLDGLAQNPHDNSAAEQEVSAKVRSLCEQFPIYPQLGK